MDTHGKSPESSDSEGYATPLASSLNDLSCHVESSEKGELTPVSSRAISPACVREIMYLQKSNNLVMTQRMLSEEDIRRLLEQGITSEEEFFDTADEHEQSQSENESENDGEDEIIVAEVTEGLLEKVADIEPVTEHNEMQVVHVEENENVEKKEVAVKLELNEEPVTECNTLVLESEPVEAPELNKISSEPTEDQLELNSALEACELIQELSEKDVLEITEVTSENVEVGESELKEHEEVSGLNTSVSEVKDVNSEPTPELESETVQEIIVAISDEVEEEEETEERFEEFSALEVSEKHSSEPSEIASNKALVVETESFPSVQRLKSKFEESQSLILNQEPTTPEKKVEDTLPTHINTDEVKEEKTSLATTAVKVEKVKFDDANDDNDADCELEEESLSSSTSTESFEFAESVPSPHSLHLSPESTQALRNSINERYPTHETETDEDELDRDSVDDFDDDLLAVKQISAEVEQLVAAINAFGRDEEQQMSAYLVGKNMAAEKKRKMSSRSDQLVQTDTDFILVDQPRVMESLQSEIERLQADLNSVKLGEKELESLNAKLQEELQESQQTIDGIEVEAEQQYTELTSEIDELCEIVLKKDQELANLKEKVANFSVSEINLKDDVDAQRVIVQRQKEIIEGLREELDNITKKLTDVTKSRDKAIEDATIYKMKNMERDRFLAKEAQMSMEIEDLRRELNKQKLILNNTSMAKLADTFDRKVLHLENELRERDMLICKQNQIINSHRKSPTGSIITQRKMQPRASVLAAAGNLNSAGSSSESFQNGLDLEAKDALLSFILSDRHNQLANIYNIGRILDLSPQEERAVERHLTKDRFS